MPPTAPSDTKAPPVRGTALLHDGRFNKGTAFTIAERNALGLQGLLPPRVMTLEQQAQRVLRNFRTKATPLDQYIYLTSLQDRNETLYYKVVLDNIVTMLPIIYTPTVGEACREFGHIYRRPRGMYISIEDRGRIKDILRNWDEKEISVIVVTDGERILGLGDLGAGGMGIPIGKLALYTACAGVDPRRCLPILLDVGTDNESLLSDPLYTGLVRRRTRGAPYLEFLDEFVEAVKEVYPSVLLQFEDFATENALNLLARYRNKICMFNDDIQGTAGVVLSGLLSAGRITKKRLTEQKILFFGAGAAAVGIANLICSAMVHDGLTPEQANNLIWFFDSKGLVVKSRQDLADHKKPYAHEHPQVTELLAAVQSLKPTAIFGVSTRPSSFHEGVLKAMAAFNERPIVFALSNPTSKSECTAEEAYRWTDGRAVFASGSPFDPVTINGRRYVPGQGNNAYVFPGVGLGVTVAKARRVTDTMFYAAAQALAETVSEAALNEGLIFPTLTGILDVSARIAAAVAEVAYAEDLAAAPRPKDLEATVRAAMYKPQYPTYA